jgi:hypothetical protein
MPYGRVGRPPRAAVVVIVTIMIALALVDLMRQDSVVRSVFDSIFPSQTPLERLIDDSGIPRPTRPIRQ